MKQTTENAFESYVEQLLLAKGWQQGQVKDWDQERALFPQQITDFITATQSEAGGRDSLHALCGWFVHCSSKKCYSFVRFQ